MASARGAWNASSPITACKKKLYAFNPSRPPQFVSAQRTRRKTRVQAVDARTIERDMRQLLADKISGNQAGIWLLILEHLRLGTWDMLCAWSARSGERVEPRMALHLVNEAAMCLCSYRHQRSLSQKGFELANGLPFIPSDAAIHEQLEVHSVAQSQHLQITRDYPQRWTVEEFFKFNQALGWKRTGTLNLHVRYAQMTLALVAQAVIHQLRKRLGPPAANWDSEHLARNLFHG